MQHICLKRWVHYTVTVTHWRSGYCMDVICQSKYHILLCMAQPLIANVFHDDVTFNVIKLIFIYLFFQINFVPFKSVLYFLGCGIRSLQQRLHKRPFFLHRDIYHMATCSKPAERPQYALCSHDSLLFESISQLGIWFEKYNRCVERLSAPKTFVSWEFNHTLMHFTVQ